MLLSNYLKSCFISVVFCLIYFIIVSRFIDDISSDNTDLFIIFSTIVVALTGIVSPLTFWFSRKFTTVVKESARPNDDNFLNNNKNLSNQQNNNSDLSKGNDKANLNDAHTDKTPTDAKQSTPQINPIEDTSLDELARNRRKNKVKVIRPALKKKHK